MPEPTGLLHRYHEWSKEIIRLYEDLLPESDYEYLYDPYWVSAYPYRVDFSQKETQSVEITVRNFRSTIQSHEIALVTPPGITADPPVLHGKPPPSSEQLIGSSSAWNGRRPRRVLGSYLST